MLTDLSRTLQTAVRQLEVEKQHIERQIAAVRKALDGAGRTGLSALPRRRRMSAAERRAVSLRMKAYWAKRRAARKKGAASTRRGGKR